MATDNLTTLYYINKQGGTHSLTLLYLAIHLWEWCYDHHIFPVAVHVSTEDNNVADRLSCLNTQTYEWVLDDFVFSRICSWWGMPAINIFATWANSECSRYCSRAGRGMDFLGDAFMVSWDNVLLYLFPPILLIQ